MGGGQWKTVVTRSLLLNPYLLLTNLELCEVSSQGIRMIRSCAFIRCSFVLCCVLASQVLAQREIDKAIEATVFIKTKDGQGSGFLIRRWDSVGLIATNAHVVSGPNVVHSNIEVVFNSGSDSEAATKGNLVAIDPLDDIALLVVEYGNLPAPLDLQLEKDCSVTDKVFIIGFPFGESLALSRRNPVSFSIHRGDLCITSIQNCFH